MKPSTGLIRLHIRSFAHRLSKIKNMKTSFAYIICLSLVFLLSWSDAKEKQPAAKKMNPTGDVINDSGLLVYNPFKLALEKEPAQKPYTILSYVDVTCSVCIAEIDKWKTFYDTSSKKDYSVKLVFF